VPLLAVHLVATLVAESAFGIEGAIAAFAVAPAGFAVVLLVAGAGPATATAGRELLADGVRFLALSAATFGGAAAAASTVEGPLAAAVAAGALGSVVYAAGLALIARRQLSVLAGSLLRPASA
jgi:hypothetical protein